jgi:voltage-gated potassium channel
MNEKAPFQVYQLFMLALCILALGLIGAQAAAALAPETRQILDVADLGLCALFFGDFLLSLWRAESRWRYLYTWGWIDLVSSIPAVSGLRWGRAARVVRILRALRGVRATRVLARAILTHRAQSVFLAVMLVSLLLLVFSSIMILQFENVPEANIKNGSDAIWWAFVTITTVGYGDRFPVTPEGRVVAALLMTAGVGLFGTFSGFVASWFIAPKAVAESTELAALRNEIALLRAALESRH